MTLMDDLAWERCPDCLGHLDAVEAGDGAAHYCRLCGFTGEVAVIPNRPKPNDDGVVGMRGY